MAQTRVTITNNQTFKRVFGRDKELCRRLVELVLGEPIEEMEVVEVQHESLDLAMPWEAHADVLARTVSGALFDIEMQTEERPDIARRAMRRSGELTEGGMGSVSRAGRGTVL